MLVISGTLNIVGSVATWLGDIIGGLFSAAMDWIGGLFDVDKILASIRKSSPKLAWAMDKLGMGPASEEDIADQKKEIAEKGFENVAKSISII